MPFSGRYIAICIVSLSSGVANQAVTYIFESLVSIMAVKIAVKVHGHEKGLRAGFACFPRVRCVSQRYLIYVEHKEWRSRPFPSFFQSAVLGGFFHLSIKQMLNFHKLCCTAYLCKIPSSTE
jgi:hypothetical protein